MKKTLLTTTLILAFASSAALASDKDAKDAKNTKAATAAATKEKAKTKQAIQKQEVLLTGSHIKREVRRDGQVTDAPNSLTIIDRKAIERSGVADLRQLLARQSAFR